MPPLVLVPCSSSKTLPTAVGLRGRELAIQPSDRRVSLWKAAIAEAQPRTPVRQLYKGGAWSLARAAAAAADHRSGTAYVVSAGLGLASFDALAPGYDITFSAGSPDVTPGGASPKARACWWRELVGPQAFEEVAIKNPFDVLLVALPEAYLDAVAPSLVNVIATLGVDRVSVLASKLSPFARQYLSDCWVPVTAKQTTTLRGNAGQTALSALVHALRVLPVDAPMTRPSIDDLIGQLARRDTPLYPKRNRLGREHAVAWMDAARASNCPPQSASEALRRYRGAGFAYEQKAFHLLFAEFAEKS